MMDDIANMSVLRINKMYCHFPLSTDVWCSGKSDIVNSGGQY